MMKGFYTALALLSAVAFLFTACTLDEKERAKPPTQGEPFVGDQWFLAVGLAPPSAVPTKKAKPISAEEMVFQQGLPAPSEGEGDILKGTPNPYDFPKQQGSLSGLQEADQVIFVQLNHLGYIVYASYAQDAATVADICAYVQQTGENKQPAGKPLRAAGGDIAKVFFYKEGKHLGGLNFGPPNIKTCLDDPMGAELTLWNEENYWYIMPTPKERQTLYLMWAKAFQLEAEERIQEAPWATTELPAQ